jgi:hypothetical protein
MPILAVLTADVPGRTHGLLADQPIFCDKSCNIGDALALVVADILMADAAWKIHIYHQPPD